MVAQRVLGAGFIGLGALAVAFGLGIQELGLGQNRDPGPRAFPLALGLILVGGGVFEWVASWMHWRRQPEEKEARSEVEGRDGQVPRSGLRHMVGLLIGLCLYVAALNWLGFTLSTMVFSLAMMILLGVRWPVGLATSVGLLFLIHVLFRMLFKVQLPAGTLGLPL